MKKLFIFCLALLFAISCEKDVAWNETESIAEVGERSGKPSKEVTLLVKCWFTAVADPASGPIDCSPDGQVLKGGWMKGHQTHGGKLQADNSPWWINECVIDLEAYLMTGHIEGKNTLANGDYYNYTGDMYISMVDGAVSGSITIDGGSGRYKNAHGDFTLTGHQDFEKSEAVFKSVGYVTFYK